MNTIRHNLTQTIPSLIRDIPLTAITLCCGLALLLVAHIIIYWGQHLGSQKEIQALFKETISIDMTNQANQSSASMRLGYATEPKIGKMTINHKDSVNFNNLSIDTRLQKLLQTYILQKNPPNAYRLDSLFQVTLSKERIGAETAIRYINNKTQAVVDSRPNAKLYTSTYALEDINLGVQEEVTIQAFVKIPPQYIIQRGKWVFLIATLSIACVTILLLIAVSVQQKAQTVIDPATGFCELSKRYRFDRENAVLYDMENPVGMSHQSARLLQLFINSPNYYLDHEFMEVTLWGSTQLQSNRREQAIARLRKSLEKKPALHIINAWGNGYQLVVGPWWNAKRVEQLFRHISRSFIKH